jgi:NAD(P)-dependent dehydrogenase (short-subunit alcohol dehydrogenase family)
MKTAGGLRSGRHVLDGKVAVVAGASRGAGRGIALALGSAGCTVYAVGRTARGGWSPSDGAPGTIEDTVEEVAARGGKGVAVVADCTDPDQAASVFDRVRREQGRLDVLANAVWGGHDDFVTPGDLEASWSRPFWEQPVARQWASMMTAGPYAYYLMSSYAMPLMLERRGGLIVGLTDGIGDDGKGGTADEIVSAGGYQGQLVWELSHHCINRLMAWMSVETRKKKIAVLTLMPGFMQTERVLRHMTSDKVKKMFRFDLSESTEYVGRAVAALAADPKVMRHSGRIHFVADLAQEYGFTDVDGRKVPRFKPFG